MSDTSNFHDEFYQSFYVEQGTWSTKYPNRDEVDRVAAIMKVVGRIASDHYQQEDATTLNILDVGSGRGWLTYVLGLYGESQGVEPVAGVVEHARATYSNHQFTVGTPQTMVELGQAGIFDLVVCSEVIEHVPTRAEQADFMQALADLIKPTGQIVLTTPRGEIQQTWTRLYPNGNQPVENWLTQDALLKLVKDTGLQLVFYRPFATHGFMIQSSLSTRVIQRLLTMIGFSGAEPNALMTYQLVQLRK